MKKHFWLARALGFMVLVFCCIAGGCKTDLSGKPDSSESEPAPYLINVSIVGVLTISANENTGLEAVPMFSGTVDSSLVNYSWEITEGNEYASISYSKNTAIVTGKNTTTSAQSATVFVTATYNGISKSAAQTISIAAKKSEMSDNPTTPENPVTPENPSVQNQITIVYSTPYAYGSSTMPKLLDVSDSGYTLTSDDLPTLTMQGIGYIFGGWARSEDSNTAVQVGETITENTTFYAIWTPITYTVKFDANGGSGNEIPDIKATYNVDFDVPENTFTLTGYKASESTWSTEKDSFGLIFTAENKASNLTTENGATVTLYAVWIEKGSHSITYFDSDGENAIGGNYSIWSFKETENVDLSGQKPEKPGYTFVGWRISPDAPNDELISGWNAGEKTSDVVLYATWKANANTSYRVDHYLQSSYVLTDYLFDDAQTFTGTTGEKTSATAKTYPGFTAKEITQETISANGSTVVSVYYDRKEITLSFDLDGGSGVASISGKYGTSVTYPEKPTKSGYVFSSWTPAFPDTFPLENATYKAVWISDSATKYTVRHFLQPSSLSTTLSEYIEREEDSQILAGETGATTSANPNNYDGFTAKEITQETISADGSTVVSVYYDRNGIILSFDSDGGSEVASVSGKYGTSVTSPKNPTKQGYTFSSWIPELPSTFPTEDTVYTANWTPSKNTAYTVKHFLQDVDLSTYEERSSDTQILTGTTGEYTSATPNTYVGFTANLTQETISADGSTVVSIYYNRNEITLSFEQSAGEWWYISPISGKYGTKVTAPENPTKEGYTFSSWIPAFPDTFPAEDMVFKATWAPNRIAGITASAPTYSSTDLGIKYVEDEQNRTFTFSTESELTDYAWYVDGSKKSTESTFTLNFGGYDYNPGVHSVMLVSGKDSGIVEITIRR